MVPDYVREQATYPEAKHHATAMLDILASRLNWSKGTPYPYISHVAMKPSDPSFRHSKLIAPAPLSAIERGLNTAEIILVESGIPPEHTVVCISVEVARKVREWDYDPFKWLRQAGVLIVAAAGNTPVPAELGLCGWKGSVGVAGFDTKNRQLPRSSYGRYVQLLGPGAEIHAAASLGPGRKCFGDGAGSSLVPYILVPKLLEIWDKLSLNSLQEAMKELLRTAVPDVIHLNPIPRQTKGSKEDFQAWVNMHSSFAKDHDGTMNKRIEKVLRDPGSTPNLAVGGGEFRRAKSGTYWQRFLRLWR